jgi:uncharacterized membrane protein (Fun14 family)
MELRSLFNFVSQKIFLSKMYSTKKTKKIIIIFFSKVFTSKAILLQTRSSIGAKSPKQTLRSIKVVSRFLQAMRRQVSSSARLSLSIFAVAHSINAFLCGFGLRFRHQIKMLSCDKRQKCFCFFSQTKQNKKL